MKHERGLGARPVVAVVGGGFSGLLTAIHLLRSDPGIEVHLIERDTLCGRARAFRPHNPAHLLNVRAANMSAFPDRPDHFVAWLGGEAAPDAFVSRGRYGDYLQSLLREELKQPNRGGRLVLTHDEAVAADHDGGGWRVALRSGRVLRADAMVLALGLAPPTSLPGVAPQALAAPAYVADPWAADLARLPQGDVLLIGSGLTMVDVALSLAGPGRRLTALSRRGLLPLNHAPTQARPPPDGSLRTPREALNTLRAYARQVGWREAVDSIRPLAAPVWRAWTLAERRRFLGRLRPWWDIHRHRMAPAVAQRVMTLRATGQLAVAAGRLEALDLGEGGFEALIRGRGQGQAAVRRFAAVVNCASPQGDPEAARIGLLAHLRGAGLLRRDPLGLGLDVDEGLKVIAADGAAAPGLFAVGPLTRGTFWEAVAVPDLRNQTAQVADAVLAHLRSVTAPPADS